eukprot:Seg1405.7 transcript_id=Seg1405.7/GoldUCD/mRNA.D3Y31 product="Bcl-2-like protein 1" protein_id=Seg1405.7/GoldUCD/D3Y31
MQKNLFSYISPQPMAIGGNNPNDVTSKLVNFYIPYRLRTKLNQAMLAGLPREYLIPKHPTELEHLLARLCLEMEDTNTLFFDGLASDLSLTPRNGRTTFFSVGKEIIQDGINWGRVIAVFTFAGVLCHHFMVAKKPQMVVEISTSLTSFLNEHVMPWVNKNGGWVKEIKWVIEFYTNLFKDLEPMP